MHPGPPLFTEVQHFRSHGVSLVVLVALVVAVLGLGFGGVFNGPSSPGTWVGALIFGAVGFLLGFGRLTTAVHREGIYAHMFPLTRRHFYRWEDIESCESVTYRPIRDFGGWGVRYGRSGKAYNVYGKRGVQLVFTDGRRLLLGSQRPDEFAAVATSHRARG